ncbi:MAG TPA: hypothetical protein VGI86_12895 [Acidimicrobiia bacterium]|jgi:hypothetical protein
MDARWVGSARLGADTARALGLVGLDALREPLGRALPRTPEQLARPDVLTALLGTEVRAARLPGERFESSNCQNFLVDVESRDGEIRTLYAKLPARELAPRVFANALGFWALECTFCRDVAARVPVRVPRVLAVDRRGSRFVLLLENINELPGARLFENRDMAAGTTVDQARRCLTAFAGLHAAFHGWDAMQREQLLPLALHPFLPARQRPVTIALNTMAVDRAHRAAPELFTAEHAATCRRAFANWDALLHYWYRDPLTLVHGDSHLANCFEYATPDGPQVGLLDFQGVHWSKGIRDVAYFLIHSLEPELLTAHEDALIDHYLAELAVREVRLEPELAREQYRSFALQPLMVGVVAVGLGGFTEREATVRTMLERELAAFDRLGFASWLDTMS